MTSDQSTLLLNRVLFVRNLPFKLKADELFELFSRFGSIRQIRKGTGPSTRGTAFVVFNEVVDSKKALSELSGFHFGGRYLTCGLYHGRKSEPKPEI